MEILVSLGDDSMKVGEVVILDRIIVFVKWFLEFLINDMLKKNINIIMEEYE